MDRSLIRTSKFLSLVLRHHPESIGLTLDEAGWVDVRALLLAARAHGHPIDEGRLVRIVHENDKQRFALSDDGRRIRANQGHSVQIQLGLRPLVPPGVLYHGTVARFLDSIRRQGLVPGERQHVHLSHDRGTAERVGQRRGKPVVLVVQAGRMHRDGLRFYRAANGVWLADHVPPVYLASDP